VRKRPWVLGRMALLQVPDDGFGMVTMMLASPTGIGDLSLSHAQEKSRLLARGLFRGLHLFPFCDEYRRVRVFRRACCEGCATIVSMAKRMPADLSGQAAGVGGETTAPERDQQWSAQGWLDHESGDVMGKFTHQLGKKFPRENLSKGKAQARVRSWGRVRKNRQTGRQVRD
jgi:hypothetical protein